MESSLQIPERNEGITKERWRELVKGQFPKELSEHDFEMFIYTCEKINLDPLLKQIYPMKRFNSQTGKNVMAIITGIDGYRIAADRTGQYVGSSEPAYDTFVPNEPPTYAKVTVHKIVQGVVGTYGAIAFWDEYVQKNNQGKPTSMWSKMPHLMLAKCAEALALRKAFPASLAGTFIEEEMMRDEVPVEAKPGRAGQSEYKKAVKLEEELENHLNDIDQTKGGSL